MNWFQALILGIIQGLTEFLPVSSSGHLELGNILLGIDTTQNLTFAVVVHGATVLSTIIVLWQEIRKILVDSLQFQWNDSTRFILKIVISMIPVGIIGIFFKDQVEGFFTGNAFLVGSMLLVTSALLFFSYFARSKNKSITYLDSFLIGIAQAFAVLPGISRAGATIATGLLLKNKREEVAKFSFLMVLIPIIAANVKDLAEGSMGAANAIQPAVLLVGFFAAFFSGWFACKWMIKLVKQGKLIYFAFYCFIVGSLAIILA